MPDRRLGAMIRRSTALSLIAAVSLGCGRVGYDAIGAADDGGGGDGADARFVEPDRITDVTAAGANAETPALIAVDAGFAVVWTDRASGNAEVFYASLDADGALAAGPLQLTADADESIAPTLAWTGSELGVIWQSRATDNRSSLVLAALSVDGARLRPDVGLTGTNGNVTEPAATWTGDAYAVAAVRRAGTADLELHRFTSLGQSLGTTTLPAGGAIAEPRIRWTGSEIGVAWIQQADRVIMVRAGTDGAVILPVVLLECVSPHPTFVALSSAGRSHLVACYDLEPARRLLADPVDADGRTGEAIAMNPGTAIVGDIALTPTDTEHVLAQGAPGDFTDLGITLYRLDSTGAPVAPSVTIAADARSSQQPALAWNGERLGVAWVSQTSETDNAIRFAILDL